jgi:hypothetical protein
VTDPGDREREATPQPVPLGQPGPAIPRWLAVVVLIALLASGALSTCLVLASEPEPGSAPPSAATSD